MKKGVTPSQEEDVAYDVVPLEWIIKNPKNYNQHPPEQIHDIKASLKRWRQVRPYVVKRVAEQQFMLAAGEGTTIAARELLAEDPEQFAHLGQAKIMIVPSHWTNEDLRGYMVADNETARKAEPDDLLLAQLLQEQQDSGYDLASVGSDEESLRQLLLHLGDEVLAQEQMPEPGDAEVVEVAERWGIIIDCADEAEQLELLGRFQEEGRSCRALVL